MGLTQLSVREEKAGFTDQCTPDRKFTTGNRRWALARGASLRDASDVCSSRGCGKIYDSHLTCMGKPCIMIDKELLLFQYYILVKLINICYTHKEKKQWQKLEL